MKNTKLVSCPLCGNEEFDGSECTECGLDMLFDPYYEYYD